MLLENWGEEDVNELEMYRMLFDRSCRVIESLSKNVNAEGWRTSRGAVFVASNLLRV